jgi:hypothetical protein
MDGNRPDIEYCVVAELGVEDDLECTKGFWLAHWLETMSSIVEHGATVIRHADAAEVRAWAKRKFDSRHEYYVIIFSVYRWRKEAIFRCCYDSPAVRGRIPPPLECRTVAEQVDYYRKELLQLIKADSHSAMLEKRRRRAIEAKQNQAAIASSGSRSRLAKRRDGSRR